MIINSNLIITESEINALGSDLQSVMQDLTLPNPEYVSAKRFGRGFYYKKIQPNICYVGKTQDGAYSIPRYYFGEPSSMDMSTLRNVIPKVTYGRTSRYECSVHLRDYQKEFMDSHEDAIRDSTGILIEMPCGHGKTVMAIWLSHLRGVQTLVLVPTNYLAEQWRQRIEEFTTASVHVFSPSDSGITTCSDFLISTMDLFNNRTLPIELRRNIGHVILDEAHRVGAETYMPILNEIPAVYRTALTATFRRDDGMHRILQYHFGKRLRMGNRFPRPKVYAIRTGVSVSSIVPKKKINSDSFKDFMDKFGFPYKETTNYISFSNKSNCIGEASSSACLGKSSLANIEKALEIGGRLDYSSLDSYLNEHSGRRKTAIKVVEKCLEAGRTVLFLSKRKDTLRAMHKYFSRYNPVLIVSETNKRSPEVDTYLQKSCRLILGVTQLAKEGLDIDRLDTLIIHLPMKDTEQAIGRISRLHESKKPPVCLYLYDSCPVTYAVLNNAKKFMAANSDYIGEASLGSLDHILS